MYWYCEEKCDRDHSWNTIVKDLTRTYLFTQSWGVYEGINVWIRNRWSNELSQSRTIRDGPFYFEGAWGWPIFLSSNYFSVLSLCRNFFSPFACEWVSEWTRFATIFFPSTFAVQEFFLGNCPPPPHWQRIAWRDWQVIIRSGNPLLIIICDWMKIWTNNFLQFYWFQSAIK